MKSLVVKRSVNNRHKTTKGMLRTTAATVICALVGVRPRHNSYLLADNLVAALNAVTAAIQLNLFPAFRVHSCSRSQANTAAGHEFI